MTGAPAEAEPILMFEAGGAALAIATDQVAEVVAMPRITRVPQAPASLQGVANLRGEVVPILSVQALLGGAEIASSRVIVLAGEPRVGLAVDRVRAMGSAGSRAEPSADEALAVLIDTDAGPARLLRRGPLLAAALRGLRTRSGAVHAAEPTAAEHVDAESADVAFLQFVLAGQAYALPLEQVTEVTRPPAGTTGLPHADAVMLGVMPLRGDLLALVSLRALLGLPQASPGAEGRVVVAAIGETRLGLMVDAVSSILRVHARDVGAVPSLLNRGAGEARIDAIVRSAGGLVSVLPTERIFLDETVAEIIAEGAGRRGAAPEQLEGGGVMEQFVLFRLAEETYGLPVGAVLEVVRLPEAVTRVPRAPAYVAGVMNHRGAVVPLIDQRRRFGVAGEPLTGQARVIVTRLEDLVAGFIVDSVEQVLDVPAAAMRTAPDLTAADETIFDRIASFDVDGRLVLLVDPRQLLDQAERDIVRDLPLRPDTDGR